jgi:integrase
LSRLASCPHIGQMHSSEPDQAWKILSRKPSRSITPTYPDKKGDQPGGPLSASRQDRTVRLYQADDDLVFGHPHTGNPIDNSKLLKRFKKALKAAELRELRLHDLRHTFGTRMAAAGVPMRTLQEWLGHRNFATTLIYADYSPSAKEAELVERAFADSGVQSGVQIERNSGDVSEPHTA